MNSYKFYYIFKFILQAFKQIIHNVESGITGKQGWTFTTPHGCWTLTLSCATTHPKPGNTASPIPCNRVIFVDTFGGAYV